MKMTRSQPSLLTLLASEWSRETITASEREERRLEIESAIKEGKRCSPGEDALAIY